MKKKTIFYPVLQLISIYFIKALHVDSLIIGLNTQDLVPEKQLILYLKICLRFESNNPDRAIYYKKMAKEIAEGENLPLLKTGDYYILGTAYADLKKNDKVSENMNKVLDLSRSLGNKQDEIISLLSLGASSFICRQIKF